MTHTAHLPGIAAEPTGSAATPAANRMLIAALALAGALISIYMSLYTLGVIDAVACGTGACAVVQSSPWAVFAGVPVPLWGVAGYGALLGLALLGVQPGRRSHRGVALGLLALSAFAFGFSAYLSWVEAVLIQAWCRWCIASAILATLIFLGALPELARFRKVEGI